MRSLKIYRLTGAAAVIVAVLSAHPLWATDCNQNGIVDKDEVRDGLSADCNENELPDECELAPWDSALRVFSQEDSPELVGAGDFNSDGYLDLVTGNEQATISVFLSRDDGSLQDPVNFPASGRMRNGFRPVDFDGDGDLDVIAPISNSVSIIANDGSGAFLEPRLVPVGGSLRAIAADDVTEDGSPDLVTVDSQGRVSLLGGLGDGTFLDPAPLEIEASTAALLLVDTDSDGHLDIVAGRKSETGISILKGAGDGAFSAALTYDAGDRNASVAVAGDFDSDGNLDLATASPFGIMVFFNDGQDGFTGVRFSSFATRSIQALDLEGDGDVDLLVVGLNTRGPYSLSNLGNGKLRKQTLAELDSPLRTAVSGDFDGDGDMDIAATTTELMALSIVFNGEQVSQEAEPLEFATVPMGSEPHSAAISDVDGDFYPDILTSNGGCDSDLPPFLIPLAMLVRRPFYPASIFVSSPT